MNFYCDVSAVGNGYQDYSDVPATWGIPQDGNGLAQASESAAVGIATIDFAGCVASGGMIAVLGVTVTSTLSQSGSALATAVAALINATSTAVGSAYCAATLPLQKLVYARVNPAINTQVQIMMRIAGTDWAGYAPLQSGITPAATISNFVGGVDGPFAYFFNRYGAFGKASVSWGCFSSARVGGVVEPDLTSPIYIRSRRDGVDLGVAQPGGNNSEVSIIPKTSGLSYRLGVFDDGTIWPGDAGMFRATYSSNSYSGVTVRVGTSNQGTHRLYLTSLGDTHRGNLNFHVNYAGNGAKAWFGNGWSGTQIHLDNILLSVDEASSANTPLYLAFDAQYGVYTANNCKIRSKGAYLLSMPSSGQCSVVFNKCDFEYFGLSGNINSMIGGSAGTNNSYEFIGCKFYDELGVFSVSSPFGVIGASDNPFRVVFDGCSGITDVFLNIAPSARSERVLTWDDFGDDRAFHVETGAWLSEWRPGNGQPTLDQLTVGGTPWSVKTLIHNVIDQNRIERVVRIFDRYLGSEKICDLKVEVLSQIQLTKSNLMLLVEYIDQDGVTRIETTDTGLCGAMLGTSPELTASSAAWAMNGQTGYTKYKLELTTQAAIRQNTDLNVYVLWRGSPVSDFAFFTNPGVSIT